MSETTRKAYALLIDGDNAQPDLIPLILKAVQRQGKPIIKRVYISTQQFSRWEKVSDQYQIKMMHHHNATNGKNATDIVLVIDAMDLLHRNKDVLDGFCIVSSDSDFTHLATRIRDDGLIMLGVGKESSRAFKESCDAYMSLERLQQEASKPIEQPQQTSPESAHTSATETTDDPPKNFFSRFIQPFSNTSSRQNQIQEQTPAPMTEIVTVPFSTASSGASAQPQVPATSNGTSAQPKTPVTSNGTSAQPQVPTSKTTRQQKDLNKLISAYTHAIGKLGQGDKDGWLSLSPLGSVLHQLYPHDDHYTYNGEKCSTLRKYVEKMKGDFPNIIEFKPPSPSTSNGQVRVKSGVK